jgi:hypothetical protein
MLVIMTTRTVYYILVGLTFEYEPKTKARPDNYYLLVIYFQECVFNFVTFYNLVLKQNTNQHQQQHFNSHYKKATTIVVNPLRRKMTDEIKDDSSSTKKDFKTKTEDD